MAESRRLIINEQADENSPLLRVENPTDIESLQREETLANARDLMQGSSKIRNAVMSVCRRLKMPVTVFLETAATVSVWSMMDNNFEGWPQTYRHRADELDEKMLYVFAFVSFLNIANAVKANRKNKVSAAISMLYSFIQAAAVGFSSADFTEDTLDSFVIQEINPGSGSTSGSYLNTIFWEGIFAPAVAIGFIHFVMEFGEALYDIANDYEFSLDPRFKKILPEKLQSLLVAAYPGLRSTVRGAFVWGGVINETVNTILQNLVKLNLDNYPAIYRTMLFGLPHVLGLAIELGLKKFASDETRKRVNFGFMLTASLMYVVQYFSDYSARLQDEQNEISFFQKFSPIFVWSFIGVSSSLTNYLYNAFNPEQDPARLLQRDLLIAEKSDSELQLRSSSSEYIEIPEVDADDSVAISPTQIIVEPVANPVAASSPIAIPASVREQASAISPIDAGHPAAVNTQLIGNDEAGAFIKGLGATFFGSEPNSPVVQRQVKKDEVLETGISPLENGLGK